MNLKSSEPELVGKVGKQTTSKVWHFLSFRSGGYKCEEQHIIQSCGRIKNKAPWIMDGDMFEASTFWLCKPNKSFTLRFHTLSDIGMSDLLYVDHYYYARLIEQVVIIEFTGQHCEWWDEDKYELYKIGDELKKTKPTFFEKLVKLLTK